MVIKTVDNYQVFYTIMVCDDDSTIRANCKWLYEDLQLKLSLFEWLRNISGVKKANHGCLPLHIKEPVLLSNPSHRVRVLIHPCFLMSRGPKCDARLTKNDCLQLKIYYGCFINKNRHKPFEDFHTASMAPIHHLFDSLEHCNPEWFPAKANKRVSKGKYRNIEDNKEMFDWLIKNVNKNRRLRSSKH